MTAHNIPTDFKKLPPIQLISGLPQHSKSDYISNAAARPGWLFISLLFDSNLLTHRIGYEGLKLGPQLSKSKAQN